LRRVRFFIDVATGYVLEGLPYAQKCVKDISINYDGGSKLTWIQLIFYQAVEKRIQAYRG
jgi:hypothetical protein